MTVLVSQTLPLARVMARIIRQTFGHSILPLGILIAEWPSIIGSRLSEHVIPLKLTRRRDKNRTLILYLRVPGPLAVEIQHQIPLILERINTFLGNTTITDIRLIQTSFHLPKTTANVSFSALPSRISSQIETLTQDIVNQNLRQALKTLGLAIAQDEERIRKSLPLIEKSPPLIDM